MKKQKTYKKIIMGILLCSSIGFSSSVFANGTSEEDYASAEMNPCLNDGCEIPKGYVEQGCSEAAWYQSVAAYNMELNNNHIHTHKFNKYAYDSIVDPDKFFDGECLTSVMEQFNSILGTFKKLQQIYASLDSLNFSLTSVLKGFMSKMGDEIAKYACKAFDDVTGKAFDSLGIKSATKQLDGMISDPFKIVQDKTGYNPKGLIGSSSTKSGEKIAEEFSSLLSGRAGGGK